MINKELFEKIGDAMAKRKVIENEIECIKEWVCNGETIAVSRLSYGSSRFFIDEKDVFFIIQTKNKELEEINSFLDSVEIKAGERVG